MPQNAAFALAIELLFHIPTFIVLLLAFSFCTHARLPKRVAVLTMLGAACLFAEVIVTSVSKLIFMSSDVSIGTISVFTFATVASPILRATGLFLWILAIFLKRPDRVARTQEFENRPI